MPPRTASEIPGRVGLGVWLVSPFPFLTGGSRAKCRNICFNVALLHLNFKFTLSQWKVLTHAPARTRTEPPASFIFIRKFAVVGIYMAESQNKALLKIDDMGLPLRFTYLKPYFSLSTVPPYKTIPPEASKYSFYLVPYPPVKTIPPLELQNTIFS